MDPIVYVIVGHVIDAVLSGIERNNIMDELRAHEAAGESPEQLAERIRMMRDRALADPGTTSKA